MKHLIILTLFVVLGYVAWHATDKRRRRKVVDFALTHVLRLGVIFGCLLVLMLAAFYLPTAGFFF